MESLDQSSDGLDDYNVEPYNFNDRISELEMNLIDLIEERCNDICQTRGLLFQNTLVNNALSMDIDINEKELKAFKSNVYNSDVFLIEVSKLKTKMTQMLLECEKSENELSIQMKKNENMLININGLEDYIDENLFSKLKEELDKQTNITSECLSKHRENMKNLYILFKIGMQYRTMDPKRTCPICLNKETELAFIPCGHTLCNECNMKGNFKTCFACRTSVDKILKLYF